MKKYTYPAVLYYDDEEKCYIIAMFDLGLVTNGETVEQAHNNARAMLDSYLECAFAFDCEIPEPSTFEVVARTHPKEICVLIESTLNDKNKAV